MWPPDAGERFYLVRRKSTSTGAKTFEPLIGFGYSGDYDIESYPIVLDAERRAGELLAPDRNWCSRTRVSCAGVDMDARVPLEDELSDDGNGVENSWRHYVDLAHRAAEDADALGEAVLNAGSEVTSNELAIAGRAESAMEEVQQICGANVDIEQLRTMLGAQSGGLEYLRTNEACTTDADCDTATNANLPPQGAPEMKYHCGGGYCVGDLLGSIATAAKQYPELERIAECVDPGTVQDFVTPGSQDLCVWTRDHQLSQLCADQSSGYPCPVTADPNVDGIAGCDSLVPPDLPGHTYEKVRIETTLGYFDYQNESAGLPNAGVCESIRALRRSHPKPSEYSAILSSEFFHPATFDSFAASISFEPRFDSHSAVMLNGTPVFQTGDAWAGTSSQWPCAPMEGAKCTGSGDPSLACIGGAAALCNDPILRAPINRRLLNAVVALRGMVTPADVEDLPGVMFPAFGTYDSAKVEPVNKFARSRTVSGLAPVEVHEVTVKNDPRKFTFNFVDAPTGYADLIAWRDVKCDGSQNCYYDNFSVAPGYGFAVVEERPSPAPACASAWLGGLSSATQKGKGIMDSGAFRAFFTYAKFDKPTYTGAKCSVFGFYPGGLPTAIQAAPSIFGVRATGEDYNSSLDALELACEVAHQSAGGGCDLSHPPNIAAEGWSAAKRFLNCAADQIQRSGALTIYADFPTKAIDALRKESTVGAFPALGGEYGAAISRLRSALVDVSDLTPLIASELRALGTDFELAESSIALTDIQKKKNDVQFEATVANQTAQCLATSAQTAGLGSAINPGQVAAAAVTCANSFAQIKFAGKLKEYDDQQSSIQAEQARLELKQRFETHATNLQTYSSRQAKAANEIEAALAEIQTLRERARKALYKAVIDSSTVGKKQAALLSVSKARFATAQRRYEAGRQNAVLAAFIAKRAVETRLGVRLSSLKEDLPLVAAPASWESAVCTSSGVSFDDVVREGGAKDFADAYVGDYVDKLENVVESYRLVNNFHEGTDTAIVSLKDDFNRVKKFCATPVGNKLFHAGDFSGAGNYPIGSAANDLASLPDEAWALAGCSPGLPDCVGISPLAEDDGPFEPSVKALSAVRGFRVTYGPDSGTCDPAYCGYQAGAYLAQKVELDPGRYRLSWYARQPSVTAVPALDGAGLAILSGPSVTVLGSEGTDVDPSGWSRHWQLFEASDAGTYGVLIGPAGSAGGAVDLAAVMLEVAPGAIDSDLPTTYANTGDTLTASLPTCVDTDGAVFRATKWRRGCVQLCSNGFNASCDGAAAQTYCYRETLVSFSQADIDTGAVFGASGIAKGNFNYRIERIGVNFTGTGLRSCEDSSSPLSCYGSGYWTYSLQHGGPYHVRNYTGQDVDVQLFAGNIEHARGLAAERYLTNPMSGADKELMETYMRREFQGRPLDGTFVLRVWEEPGMNFDALEDVQLALEYRYWTRFK